MPKAKSKPRAMNACQECKASIPKPGKFCKGKRCKAEWDARVKRERYKAEADAKQAKKDGYELRKATCHDIAKAAGTSLRQLFLTNGITIVYGYKLLEHGFRERNSRAAGTREKLEAAGLLEAMKLGLEGSSVEKS